MKKRILVLTLVLSLTFYGTSQVNPHAIGLRGGSGNFGYGGEISYQHGFGDANRLELDLGARRNKYYGLTVLTGIYHWVWNITEGLNWYVGPGAQLGLYNGSEAGLWLSVGGQIGIEYDFNQHDIPLLLGLDTRPMFLLNSAYSGFGYGGAFSLRYTF
jgi:hypothetical protein